jgi:transcriptional regulator with XRE-family HTH domain
VANRRDRVAEAGFRARRLLDEMGTELREARLMSGLSQQVVATRLRTSQKSISRAELGAIPDLSVDMLSRHAAVLGLRLHLRLYPNGGPLRDQAQLALLQRLRPRLSPSWSAEAESPLPLQGDLRAWDLLLNNGKVTIGVEAVTRLRDIQALLRSVRQKQRDGRVTRVLVVLSATEANRRALAAAGGPGMDLSIGGKSVLAALAAGRDPGVDAVVFL